MLGQCRAAFPRRVAAHPGRRGSPLRSCRRQQSEELAVPHERGGCPPKHDCHDGSHHILRSRAPAGALHLVGDRQGDGVHAGHGERRSAASRPAMAGRARLRRAATRRKSGRLVLILDTDRREVDLLPRAVRSRGGGRCDTQEGIADARLPTGCWREIRHGQTGSRNRRDDRRLPHRGARPRRRHGDAVARHARRGSTMPMLMKVPKIARGRRSGGHRQLRDGADDHAAPHRRRMCRNS